MSTAFDEPQPHKTIALLQTPGAVEGLPGNLAELEQAAREVKRTGADLLLTPELFLTGYDIAVPYTSLPLRHALDECQRIADEVGLGLIVCLPETDALTNNVYNTAYFIGRDGAIVAKHRKSHLFGDSERRAFVAGEEAFAMVDFEGLRIAMMICYDVEFPEAVRAAALAGAHLVAVPTAQMEPFDFVASHVIRVRAWENQVYVAYANHAGIERSTRYIGGSSIVDPSGAVLASVGAERSLVQAVVSPGVVNEAQKRNPYLRDRRPALYFDSVGAR